MRVWKEYLPLLVVGFLHDSGIFTKIHLIFNVIYERGLSLYCTSEVFFCEMQGDNLWCEGEYDQNLDEGKISKHKNDTKRRTEKSK